MFVKQVELQRLFNIGSTHCTHVCRLIDERHDRYGELPNIGSRYNIVCFADALANYRNLKDGLQVRNFDYDKVAKELPNELTSFNEDECKAQYDAGAEAMKSKIFHNVWDYFDETYVEKGEDVKPNDLMRIIKQGVMTKITGSKL